MKRGVMYVRDLPPKSKLIAAPSGNVLGYVRRINANGLAEIVLGPVPKWRRFWWKFTYLLGLR